MKKKHLNFATKYFYLTASEWTISEMWSTFPRQILRQFLAVIVQALLQMVNQII